MAENYAFASMMVRDMEGKLISDQQWHRLVQAKDLDDAVKILRETRYADSFASLDSPGHFEKALDQEFSKVAQEIFSLVEDQNLKEFIFLQYDLHNLKLMIKDETEVKKKQGSKSTNFSNLAFDFSAFDQDEVRTWIREPDKNLQRTGLEKAVAKGVTAWQDQEDAQTLDFVLDSAGFEVMADLVEELDSELFKTYQELMVDANNILSFFRANRQDQSLNFLAEVLLDGGRIPPSFFLSIRDHGDRVLKACKYFQMDSDFIEAVSAYLEDGKISALERAKDELQLKLASRCLQVTDGPEVLFGYMLTFEKEVQNLRILLTGKRAGLEEKDIEERMRGYA